MGQRHCWAPLWGRDTMGWRCYGAETPLGDTMGQRHNGVVILWGRDTIGQRYGAETQWGGNAMGQRHHWAVLWGRDTMEW